MTLEQLEDENGIDETIAFMDGLFKKDELTEVYERYVDLNRFLMKSGMNEFILETAVNYRVLKELFWLGPKHLSVNFS